MNITAKKTSTLNSLQRQLNDATTIAAKAQSAYDSYVNKAQLYQNMLTLSTKDLNTVNANWALFLKLKSSLDALHQTAGDNNMVAQVTLSKIKKLVIKWEQVVQQTLEAADAINLATDYINSRKSSNRLISDILVAEATLTSKNSEKVVTQVISALTATLNTLAVSNQAVNSSNLTDLYIDETESVLLKPKTTGSNNSSTSELNHIPLEVSLGQLLTNTKKRQNADQTALDKANAEMADAKEKLGTANAKVASSQAALDAALAAIAA